MISYIQLAERHIFARACVALRAAAQLDSRRRHLLPRRRQGQDRGRRATHEDRQVHTEVQRYISD